MDSDAIAEVKMREDDEEVSHVLFPSPDPVGMDYAAISNHIETKLPNEAPVLFGLHPNAEIAPGAIIGNNCTIWAGTRIGPNARIGNNVRIGRNCEVDCIVGNNCQIQAGALLYHGVTLAHFVFVGPGVVTTNDIMPRVGDEWDDRFRRTRVCVGASIGANATIICGIAIGEHSMIGAGSVVTHDVKPWWLVRGNPAHHIRELPHMASGTVEVEP